jgi:transposase InsO family protein
MVINTHWRRLLNKRINSPYFGTGFEVPVWTGENSKEEAKRYSSSVKKRLEWIIFYKTRGENGALTSRHFGISTKTFFKFRKRFKQQGLKGLDDYSKRPINTRVWEITSLEETRIRNLRKKYIRIGKMKLVKYYQLEYGDVISSWKIQRVIEKYQLYYHPLNTAKKRRKHTRGQIKKRISQAPASTTLASLIHVDTIVFYWNNTYRYILTAIDDLTRIAYARMYEHHSSRDATDFLKRLKYLLSGNPIQAIHTDNGSEFAKHFKAACTNMNIDRYFSRVRMPKDNAMLERFNRTLQEEFIEVSDTSTTTQEFNQLLTEWLIEYNFKRPHQSLSYLTPMEYADTIPKPLPMYPSSTHI